jgi:hypothetical protein
VRSSTLALLFAFATSAASAALVVSCSAGGNGIGSAPAQPPPCPAGNAIPRNGDPCKGPQVCGYPDPTCTGETGACGGSDIVALCPSANSTWQVSTRGDGGAFADAPIEEVSTDGATDGDAEPSDAPADSEIDSGTDSETIDSGAADSGSADSGPMDTGTVDSGTADSGTSLDVGLDLGLDALGD